MMTELKAADVGNDGKTDSTLYGDVGVSYINLLISLVK